MSKKDNLVRINSRVTPEQKKQIKEFAKDKKISEGEAHRIILAEFFNKK